MQRSSSRVSRLGPWLLVLILVASLPPATGGAATETEALMQVIGKQVQAPAAADGTPHYVLTININTVARTMAGQMSLEYTNRTGVALPNIMLRLYPNFPPDLFGDAGSLGMELQQVRVNGVATKWSYQAQRTAASIALAAPLRPGASARIDLGWTVRIQPWQRSDGSFPLTSHYPMLAAWTGEWRMDYSRFPDRVFATAATYRASINVPAGYAVIASGSTTGSRSAGGRTTYDVVTGPVREFAFSVGRFAAAHASHAGIAVNVYHKPGDGLDAAARQVALHAAASLAVYGDRFGPYPYAELDFHLINARRGFDIGAEFPGLIILLVNRGYTQETRFVTAHEVAHQWWYGVVGNDIYKEPWLDESFAQWSPLLVEEVFAGQAAADQVYQRYIVRLAQRTRLPAGLSIGQYGNWNTYYAAVYGRGAQFLQLLRGEVGDKAFFAGLRSYYADNTHGIGTTAEVRAALEQSSGRDLGKIFNDWIGR